MQGLEWDNLRLLLALLRTPTTEQAARQLDVDRSTISRRLLLLEKGLGARLFTRTREGLLPTAAALRLRPLVESMELTARSLSSAVRDGQDRVGGNVRVATTEALAALLVSEGLLSVNDQHPELSIELLGGNRPLDVARGEADIALRLSAVREATLRVRCIARIGIALFASPLYLRARGGLPSRGSSTSIGILKGHDLLLPTGELARLPESRWLSTRKGARIVFRSNSMTSLIAAAIAGRGMVPLPLSWGQNTPGLEQVLILDHIPKRPIWLVTRAETPERKAVRVVSDQILSILSGKFTHR
jgi:DNA-binding transcriptional LysR family regulator